MSKSPSRRAHHRRIVASLLGLLLGISITGNLPIVAASVISALLVAGAATLMHRLKDPAQWWGLLSMTCGGLVGAATSLVRDHFESHLASTTLPPAHTVLMLALAGAVAGHSLARDLRESPHASPQDLLRSATALTTGIFACYVTVTYVFSGLDEARVQASRLSTGLTVLVFSVAVPGWISHLLSERRSQPPDR